VLYIIDNLVWIIVGISVLVGIAQVLFWVFLGMGVFKSTQNYQQNIFSQLFGTPIPQRSQKELDGAHRRKYASFGLIIGIMVILLGALMIFSGLGGGEIELSVAGIQLNRTGPGTVLCVLGVIIMKYTKL